MSKLVRLVDFQVYARLPEGAGGGQRPVNEALFATYEPVRLWLKEHAIRAPFRKLLVSLADDASSARWHGNVSNVAGICEVTESIDAETLRQGAGDQRWVLGVVKHALDCVADKLGWRSDELESLLNNLVKMTWPLVHFFEDLVRVDKIADVKCEPWLSVAPGETRIGVRLGDHDTVVLSKQGPLYLEDSFPVAGAAIRGREYVLLDKAGKVLASVSIEGTSLH